MGDYTYCIDPDISSEYNQQQTALVNVEQNNANIGERI